MNIISWFLLLLMLLCTLNVQTQSNSFIDSRDGRTYQTVEIENKIWFKENLQLATKSSHCPNFNKKESDCNQGNYYSNSELKTLCPKGWRVATLADWEDYFNFMKIKYGVDNNQIKIDTLTDNAEGAMILDASREVELLGEETPLNLHPIGWVEGKEIQNFGTITLWINNEVLRDPKYHVHI